VPDQYALLAVLSALWRESLLRVARARGLTKGKTYASKDGLTMLLLRFPGLTLSREFLDEFEPFELAAACRKLRLDPGSDRRRDLVEAILGAGEVAPHRHDRKWRPFPEARVFARSLGILDLSDWGAYARGELKGHKGVPPEDIPKAPWTVYRGEGWRGIRDFIGTDAGLPAEEGFLPFKSARRLARRLGFKSKTGWDAWCRGAHRGHARCPGNLPQNPQRIYAKAWRGWKDWLGTTNRSTSRFRSFVEARAFAQDLLLNSAEEWRSWLRGDRPELGSRPEDIPACPNVTYHALGWRGYGDWLGTGNKSKRGRPRMPFEDARRLARSLGLENAHGWDAWWRANRRGESRDRQDIPAHPFCAYRDEGWMGWNDFLGNGRRVGPFREFRAAREWARTLALKAQKDWYAFCRGEYEGMKKPVDIPVNPCAAYQGKGWISFRDWLGTAWETRDGPRPVAVREQEGRSGDGK